MRLLDRLSLERIGPAEAQVGVISLPLPRDSAAQLRLDHQAGAMVPVGWWREGKVPRRVIAYVVDGAGVPETLRLTDEAAPPLRASTAETWSLEARISREQLDFSPPRFYDIESLRGVPASECTTVEFELVMTFAGRTVRLQFGATGPDGDPRSGVYNWQNVQIDRLWKNAVAQGVRVGGVIYNEDTYLWADVYLVLFSNGVVDAAAHFVNTKLHIEGYDFQGLPLVRLMGGGIEPVAATVPGDGHQFALGDVTVNLADAARLCSAEHPGRIEPAPSGEEGVIWLPFSRTFSPQLPDAPPNEWPPGFARTVRFQMSMSDAPPLIARYRAPSWWYAVCGEPWPWGYLPVTGRHAALAEQTADGIGREITRGRFDAGYGPGAAYGDAGMGMLQTYYHSGRPEVFEDAMNVCYFWADLAVDHRDFSVHQMLGDWLWKTCAYSKFGDVLYGYLETGDPYLLDVAEMCADSYWQWFRANWPRCAIGRDVYPLAGLARMWRMLDSDHARRRAVEIVRMVGAVLQSRGTVGDQMGGGPHPGYLSSLYMTGVCMISLLEVAEAQVEKCDQPLIEGLPDMLLVLNEHYMRQDVEVLPCFLHRRRGKVPWRRGGHWSAMACRIYPELARIRDRQDEAIAAGLRRCCSHREQEGRHLPGHFRSGPRLIPPLYHDALMLGARWTGEGVRLEPLGEPDLWPDRQAVHTPLGKLDVIVERDDATVSLRFSAPACFPVEVVCGDWVGKTSSTSSAALTVPRAAAAGGPRDQSVSGGRGGTSSCSGRDPNEAPR